MNYPRVLFAAGLSLLMACSPAPIDPGTQPPPPEDVQRAYLKTPDIQAAVTGIYASAPAMRAQALTTFYRTLGFNPTALRAQAVPDDFTQAFQPSRDLARLLSGLEDGLAVTLDSWVQQANDLGYRGPAGEPLTTAALEVTMARLAQKPEVQPSERMLAVIAAISQRRTTGQVPTPGHTFGDGLLDPVQLYLLNGHLLALALTDPAATPLQALADDPAKLDLDFFKMAYGTVKDVVTDTGNVLDRLRRAGQFMDCSTFLTTRSSLNLSATPTSVWYKGIGPAAKSTVSATVALKGDVSDSDLRYYAAANCAPTANRTLPGVTLRWLLGRGGERHGTLSSSEGTTGQSGRIDTTFDARDETTPSQYWLPENRRTSAVTVNAVMSGFSKAYPYLEARAIDVASQGTSTRGSQVLEVNHYQKEMFEGPYEWHREFLTYGGVNLKVSGDVKWAQKDADRWELAGGHVSYTWTTSGCTISAPTLEAELTPDTATGTVVFYEDGGVLKYGVALKLLNTPSVTLSVKCDGGQPAIQKVDGGDRVVLVYLGALAPTEVPANIFEMNRVREPDGYQTVETLIWKWTRLVE